MLTVYPRLGGPLYKVDQVPEEFHESFIVKGYRSPKSSAIQCILSVFEANNETLNFWTHFLPCWYFLWVLKGLSEEIDFWNDPYSWPLLTYMLASCAFPMASAIAHVFNTMSDKARHVCFFVDYAALSVFTFGVAVSYRAYVFPDALRQTVSVNVFVIGAVVNAMLCTVVSCHSRFMTPGLYPKLLRISAFAAPYFYNCSPVIYRLLYGTAEELAMESQYYHFRQFIFIATSAFLYVSHIPERFYPGWFDIVGHSHQLFHVFTILALLDQMRATLMDQEHRRPYIDTIRDYPSAAMCLGLTGLVVLHNALIVLYFSFKLDNSQSKTSIGRTTLSEPAKLARGKEEKSL